MSKVVTLTPEEKARDKIDRLFEEAGWQVINREDYYPSPYATAVREGLLEEQHEADYLLFLNEKVIGVLEAKRETIKVDSEEVSNQVKWYTEHVPSWYQVWQRPLPFRYQSNGRETYFYDTRQRDGKLTLLNRIHSPKELVRKLSINDLYAGLPVLKKKGLRTCQYEAIINLEKSFREGQTRALMVLATGAGKTYVACMVAYRFLSYVQMRQRRILFLVDRNNLAKQTEGAFGTFALTENGDKFNTIFSVERLHSSKIPKESNVVISTIQRLFSLLKGEEITDNDEEESYEPTHEVELPKQLQLPPDFFDLIIIDECHRSIYGNWQKVLNYFSSAKMIGLTATPIDVTRAFFNNNCIVNYTLEQSIVDGVNVPCRIYRIKTEATENGGAIRKGDKLRRETRYTGKIETITQKETQAYTEKELNRSIVNPAQIKLVLETFRDVVYTELFTDPTRNPNFDYLPKTLIFALNEAHANNIVRIAKEVFNRTDDKFVQKITYSSGNSNELIRQFCNSKEFRIAVTCTLVATGTDVKPLEVVMFMRDVDSEPLYIQMKGRGVRTLGDDALRNVTPNASSKDYFILVDAVGVTEHEKHLPIPEEDKEGLLPLSLKRLLELLSLGNVQDEYLYMIAGRLARIYHKSTPEQRDEFVSKAQMDMKELSGAIFSALENQSLPPFQDINQPNKERKNLIAPLINHPEAQKYLLILSAGFVTTLMPGEDRLIEKGFSVEEAQKTTSAFETYCNEHRDKIEALRILYNNDGTPIHYDMLKNLEIKIREENSHFIPSQLWNSYALVYPNQVKRHSTKEDREALTNLIQLVRFAFHQILKLESIYSQRNSLFNLWYGQLQREITQEQIEVMRKIVGYVASNGMCTFQEICAIRQEEAMDILRTFGNKDLADQSIQSLSKFLIYNKTA